MKGYTSDGSIFSGKKRGKILSMCKKKKRNWV